MRTLFDMLKLFNRLLRVYAQYLKMRFVLWASRRLNDMADVNALNSAIADLQTSANTYIANVNTKIAATPEPDYQPGIDAVNGVKQTIDAANTALGGGGTVPVTTDGSSLPTPGAPVAVPVETSALDAASSAPAPAPETPAAAPGFPAAPAV